MVATFSGFRWRHRLPTSNAPLAHDLLAAIVRGQLLRRNLSGGSRMRLSLLVSIAFAAVLATAPVANAAPITLNVAEFRWNVVGDTCNVLGPTSDDCLSTFSLTYLWDGPAPEPVVSGNLSIDGAFFGTFFDLDPFMPFDQFALAGVPTTAEASISFLFGSPISLSAVLNLSPAIYTPEGASHLFQHTYDDGTTQSVPEPSTLALVGLGLLGAWRSRARA
jgi:hypothetical protein